MKKTVKKFADESNIEVIEKLILINNGYITSKDLTNFGISREYLSIMVKKNKIEKIANGIYIDVKAFEDSMYTFSLKNSKTIFSHMTALYLHDLSEVIPATYDITVPHSYHSAKINKQNVFYVNKNFIGLGLVKITTPGGHKVRAYDIERCICDVIRSKKRMDTDQLKKCIRAYIKSPSKDMTKLSMYSSKMGINKEVMEFVGLLYE